ncbi:DEAD/DEAH box helicase, partial [Vogesella oryzae]|uniref:DEAD/DEAH box helicase n=1 Tax=Vogesella oryzae TaxID=1735285 RepID=UPI0015824CB4
MPFSSFALDPALLHALDEAGYPAATAIQQAAIPLILAGHDLLATAHTGAGKTAAYCLPLLQHWLARKGGRQRCTLVLLPTRELAQQVGSTLQQLAAHLPRCKIVTAYGGVSINPQLMALRGGADFVIATPGRLLDLIDNNALDCGCIDSLVLDEADRLLALGFADELNRILALLPAKRQTLLFSATFAANVQQLAAGLLQQPQRVHIAAEQVPDIVQRAIEVDARQRNALLLQLLQQEAWPQVMLFVNSKHDAAELAQWLQREGIRAAALHGELAQGRRERVLDNLKNGTLQVLVATDLAARGIDVPALPAVVNMALPRSPQDYTHRIGRTGRAGQRGVAVSLIDADSRAHFRLIEKRLGLVGGLETRQHFARQFQAEALFDQA